MSPLPAVPPSAPFTMVMTGSEQTATDNTKAAIPSRRCPLAIRFRVIWWADGRIA
jgi:hypothetical protein